MMSSVMQQQGNVPDITFSVAYPADDGIPTTEEVCAFFKSKGLKIREQRYPDFDSFQFRGIVRNRQLAETNAEWILFSDADMSYSPFFFEDLSQQVEGDLKDETLCITGARISLDKEYCTTYFNKKDDHTYPCVVDRAGELDDWPCRMVRRSKYSRNVGAGYFQLANVAHIRKEHGGLYVPPDHCGDRPLKTGQLIKSDRRFRNILGGIKRIYVKPQFHLNHERDRVDGNHMTNQR